MEEVCPWNPERGDRAHCRRNRASGYRTRRREAESDEHSPRQGNRFKQTFVSASRQRWIDDLRTTIANFQAAVTEADVQSRPGRDREMAGGPATREGNLPASPALHFSSIQRSLIMRSCCVLVGSRLMLVSKPPSREIHFGRTSPQRKDYALGQAILKA